MSCSTETDWLPGQLGWGEEEECSQDRPQGGYALKLGWFTWSRACRKGRWALPAKASALEDNYSKFQNPEKKKKKTLETFSRSPPFDPFPFNRQGKCVWRVWLAQDHKVGGGDCRCYNPGWFCPEKPHPQQNHPLSPKRKFHSQTKRLQEPTPAGLCICALCPHPFHRWPWWTSRTVLSATS